MPCSTVIRPVQGMHGLPNPHAEVIINHSMHVWHVDASREHSPASHQLVANCPNLLSALPQVDICEEYAEALHGPLRPESQATPTTDPVPGRGSLGSRGAARAHYAPSGAAQGPAAGAADEGRGMHGAGAIGSAAKADRDAELFARMDALAQCEAEAEGLEGDMGALGTDGRSEGGAGAPPHGAMQTPAEAEPGPRAAAQQTAPGGPVRTQARTAPSGAPPGAAKLGPPAAASPGLRRGFLGARPARSAGQPTQPSGATAEQGPNPEPKPGLGSAEVEALPGARPGAVVERTPAARMRAVTEGDRPGPGRGHVPGPADHGRRDPAGALQHPEPTPGALGGVSKQAEKGGAADHAQAVRPVSRFKQLRQARGGV